MGKAKFRFTSGATKSARNPIKSIDAFDTGDIVGAEGTIFRTRTGELTLLVDSIELLSKSIRPLPEKWHGLQDKQTRYRQRYADLIMNPEVKDVFLKRTQIVQAIRDMLNAQNFIEVETPVLQPIYGGANARPFTTYHNTLEQSLYLRIAMNSTSNA